MQFSVIIPCHNASRWIGEALRSVAEQTVAPHEIIVINDASTDDSVAEIQKSGVTVRLLQVQERNAAAARNHGIQAATGDWIALLDADDRWYPNHLERAKALLAGADDVAYRAICDDMDRDGNTVPVTIPQPITTMRTGLTHAEFIEFEANEMYFGHSSVVMRRDRFLEIGGYDTDQVRRHDIDMWLRLIFGKTWCYDPVPSVAYRADTPGSICTNLASCEYYYLRMLLKNRPAYDGSALQSLIQKTARRAMSFAFMEGTKEDWHRACDIAWQYLPRHFRTAYSLAGLAPWPLRQAIRLKRAIFTMRTGIRLPEPGEISPAIQSEAPAPNDLTAGPIETGRNGGGPRRTLLTAFARFNTAAANFRQRFSSDSSALIVLAFHGIVADHKEFAKNLVFPPYVATRHEFERCVEHFLGKGYRAVSALDACNGLPAKGRFVMFTFDDGYANNLHVLPMLEKHRVPALFALATDFVTRQKPFWWDVIHREEAARGTALLEIIGKVDSLSTERPQVIEERLAEQYGEHSLRCHGEIDRPLRPEEVSRLAKHPLIFWGNHTAGHEYLPAVSLDEARQSIGRGQDVLQELTGQRPAVMVYPFGGHNSSCRALCRQLGMRIGLTTVAGKVNLPLSGGTDRAMRTNRFAIAHRPGIIKQCLETRLDWKPSWQLWGHPASRVAT